MKKYLIVILGLLFVFSACKNEETHKEEAPELGQVFKKGMNIEATKQGRIEWKMNVKTLTQKEEQVKKVYGNNIKLYLYDENENLIMEIESDSGTANLTSNNVFLEGNVELTNKRNKTKLYTDVLNYDSEKERIYTDSEVKIIKGESVIHGKGMNADLKMNEITLKETYGKK